MTLSDRLAALSSVAALGDGRLPDELLADLRGLDQRAGIGCGCPASTPWWRGRSDRKREIVAVQRHRPGPVGFGRRAPADDVGHPGRRVRAFRCNGTAGMAGDRARQYSDAKAAPELCGLVLLDLPDHDSTELSHRAEVDRLVRLVDAFVWVLDPQKYADAVLHDAYRGRWPRTAK